MVVLSEAGLFTGDWSSSFGVASGCIFEKDAAEPLWSHANLQKDTTVGIRSSQLVVRSMANSGNYDYYANVVFSLDGSIEWKSQLAGFAETRWFSPDVNAWESEISPLFHDDLAIPVHSHLLCVKADLDIGAHDTDSVERLESVAGFPPEARAAGVLDGLPTKFLRRSHLSSEGEGASTLVANSSRPQIWRVVSRDAVGPASNSPPGYAVMPGEAMVNTLPRKHPLVPFVSYSKYTLAVTRRHDAEQRVTSAFDAYDPGHPFTSLDHYMGDQESLDRTDVVVWVTVPHEHIPRTEDIPLYTNYAAGFRLLPWNYFDGNAAMDVPPDPPANCVAPVQ